jgi:predicted NUDIX family phosphoesterase
MLKYVIKFVILRMTSSIFIVDRVAESGERRSGESWSDSLVRLREQEGFKCTTRDARTRIHD